MTLCIQKQHSLKHLNTFALDSEAKYFTVLRETSDIPILLADDSFQHAHKIVLGGGSNVLLSRHLDAFVIHNQLKGITQLAETSSHVDIAFAAGENWHDCVRYCVQQGYQGIENLALIPGLVGATPVQNIGAYGVELKDVFLFCDAIALKTGESIRLDRQACQFGYRDSIFKQRDKNKFLITQVALRLNKIPQLNLDYPALQQQLAENHCDNPDIQAIYQAVIAIRQAKLPDPAQIPNAGSFFKNPLVCLETFAALKKIYPEIPHFKTDSTHIKLPAAWLIEQCGFKGLREETVGVHERQALVLVNYGGASDEALLALAARIQRAVDQRFQVKLEFEVQHIT